MPLQSPRLPLTLQGGINTITAPDNLQPGEYPYLANVRKIIDRITARPPLGANLLSAALPLGIRSLIRMNDPYLPGSVYISGTNGKLYVNATQVASGMTGDPYSFLPYTPPDSPQPWCYIADYSLGVSVPAYSSYGPVTGMLKVRSDGTTYKMGIKEPQAAPAVSTSSAGGTQWVSYRYTYRSSITGATSNPSPESAPVTLPQTSVSENEAATSTNVTFNGSQYEINGSQLRTTGGTAAGTTTDYIVAKNFGFAIPTTVTINGAQAAMQWLGQYAGTGIISGVALFYQGSIIGQAKAPGIQNSQSPTTAVQGGPADSWGAVLTPAIVNDTTFGIGFQITTAESGGSDRSFVNNFTATIYYTTLSATLTCTPSADPQVDKIDIYRQDPGLLNFTYVGTVENIAPSFTDTLTDLQVAVNPQLSFDNYEPFPSIDLPRQGTLTVGANGACTYVSGDQFNISWLPGNIVTIDNGSGAELPYELYNRPTSTTSMRVYSTAIDPTTGYLTISFPPTGTALKWEITTPTLAAQPSPVIWGPTPDNAGSYYFGLDLLNPGDLVWSMGNNFDSAPDTNRLYVTSASEALQNGTVTSELSTVFSTERFWLIYPNFSDAVATVTGTQGQQWTLVQSAATRGLYMRFAICALGSMIAWRAKDGIFVSQGGGPEKCISESIRNLFPQGGQLPTNITIAGQVIYPPNDANAQAQTMTAMPGYIFYDYQDVNGNPRTLVYDEQAKGWTVDGYTPSVNTHSWAVGVVSQIFTGCADGTVRAMTSSGSEVGNAVVVTPSINGGSARTLKRIGGVFLRALAKSAIARTFFANRYATQITGVTPANLATSSTEADLFSDFTSASNADVQDLGMLLTFPIGSGNWLKEWQPDWTEIPEPIVAWRTGKLTYGKNGWMHIPWIRFAYQSTTAVILTLYTDAGAGVPGAGVNLTLPSTNGVAAKYFIWVPAISNGAPMKFRMIEWIADAGGIPFTVYGKDIEVAIGVWGRTGPYEIIRPFREQYGVTT